MDANNNSPKVVSSNLPVPMIIVQPSTPSTPLPSTPKRKILPPVFRPRMINSQLPILSKYGHKKESQSKGCRGCHKSPSPRRFRRVSTPVSEQLARRRVETNSVNTGNTINKLPEKIENKLMKKVYDNRLVDENIGLKGDSTRIKCEELEKQLSESREKKSGLEEANLSLQEEITKITEDGRKKVNELLKINEDLEQDKDTEISRLRNILEDGGARGDTTLGLQTQPEKLRKKSIGRPKKGRKSVNFTVPSKGAQSSKAMRRSQSSYAKINKTLLKEGKDIYSQNGFLP